MNELLEQLKSALRYIEVQHAYQGAMTADQVEAKIKEQSNVSSISIGANSVTILAKFDFHKTREVIAQAEESP